METRDQRGTSKGLVWDWIISQFVPPKLLSCIFTQCCSQFSSSHFGCTIVVLSYNESLLYYRCIFLERIACSPERYTQYLRQNILDHSECSICTLLFSLALRLMCLCFYDDWGPEDWLDTGLRRDDKTWAMLLNFLAKEQQEARRRTGGCRSQRTNHICSSGQYLSARRRAGHWFWSFSSLNHKMVRDFSIIRVNYNEFWVVGHQTFSLLSNWADHSVDNNQWDLLTVG